MRICLNGLGMNSYKLSGQRFGPTEQSEQLESVPRPPSLSVQRTEAIGSFLLLLEFLRSY